MGLNNIFSEEINVCIESIIWDKIFLNKKAEKLNGKSTVIPNGKYKGRWGKIHNAHFDTDDCVFSALIYPYNLKTKDGSVVENDYTRYYKDLSNVEEILDNPPKFINNGINPTDKR